MTHFVGFSPDFVSFFRDLAASQDREWFHANKKRYEAVVKEPMSDFVVAVNAALAERQVPLAGDPKRSVTRINRDVRFSSDRSPYKTYTAATFTRQAGEMSPGLLYVSLSADDCFAGLGFYAVGPADLSAMRTAIAIQADAWATVTTQLGRRGHPLENGETLKRMPRGFEGHANTAVADDLRLKAYVCKLRLDPRQLGPTLPVQIANFASGSLPLLNFGWQAVGLS